MVQLRRVQLSWFSIEIHGLAVHAVVSYIEGEKNAHLFSGNHRTA